MNQQGKNNIKNNNNFGEIIIYEGVDGAPRIQAQMKDETVWLSQNENSVTEEYSITEK